MIQHTGHSAVVLWCYTYNTPSQCYYTGTQRVSFSYWHAMLCTLTTIAQTEEYDNTQLAALGIINVNL